MAAVGQQASKCLARQAAWLTLATIGNHSSLVVMENDELTIYTLA